MAASDPVVIVGGGIAGHAAAVALGEAGTEVVLLDAAPHAPYDRPELSKRVLVGEGDRSSVTLTPNDWWAQHDVRLITGAPVARVDSQAVVTAAGAVYPFSSLVLATGTTPRRLPVPGRDLAGVFTVNDLDGSLRCAAALEGVEHVAVVGAGFIGCEAAAALRRAGREVTMIDTATRPLAHAVGTVLADWFTKVHQDEGVHLRLGGGVAAFEGEGHVRGVRLASGELIAADLVIVSVGVVPNLGLASAAGCAIDDGVIVDAILRTSQEAIFAIGDIASVPSRFVDPCDDAAPGRLRCEHYNVAVAHGQAVARTILGDGVPFDGVPTFWTDQYDLTINAVGVTGTQDDVVVRGSLEDRDFVALFFVRDRIVSGVACGQRRELRALRQLLERGITVRHDDLRDQATSLASLVADATARATGER